MSYLMSKYDEITVFLLFKNFDGDLPTLGKFKKLLGSTDVCLYKSGGWFSEDVRMLREAIYYSSSSSLFPLGHGGPYGSPCSDLILTKLGESRSDFLRMVHPKLVVDAFNLTKENFAELELLLKKIKAAKDVHLSYKAWCRNVQRNIDKFGELEINDSTVLDFDVAAIDNQSKSYAIQTLVDTHNQICQWVTKNRCND